MITRTSWHSDTLSSKGPEGSLTEVRVAVQVADTDRHPAPDTTWHRAGWWMSRVRESQHDTATSLLLSGGPIQNDGGSTVGRGEHR